jgi:hypothetical protein
MAGLELFANQVTTVTFAASGTSRVSTGASCIIPAHEGTSFRWSANAGLWFQMRNSSA